VRVLWMRVFQEVVRRGSITEASRALGYTQSAVSRHVAALEAEYGVRLLERGPSGVEPTPYGFRLLQHADSVLAHDALLRREIDGLQRGILGHVTVGAFPTAVAGLIPAAFAALRDSRPATTVSLIEATTPALLERIHAGDLDVAVVTEGPNNTPAAGRLPSTHLLDDRIVVAVGHGHRLARRRTVHLRELMAETFITGSETDENQLLRAHRLPDFRPRSQVVVADWIGKFACVAAGIGIALVPQLVTRSLPAGVLILRLLDGQAPYRRVLAVTNPRQQPSALTNTFISLAKHAAQSPNSAELQQLDGRTNITRARKRGS
jgi:DNA-binding transcriptional LysR family regulator